MKSLMINGEPRETEAVSLEALFEELGLPAPLLLVEHNGRALHRSEWAAVILADGDRLELMSVAAGG
jgi:thiamine biosynthesis protein ThiS